jgi:hypothetical protein
MMTITTEFLPCTCGDCGLTYAVEKVFMDCRMDSEDPIHCPGCGRDNFFFRDKPEEKQKAESADVVSLKRQLAQALHNWEQCEAKIAEMKGGETAVDAATSEKPSRKRKVPAAEQPK